MKKRFVSIWFPHLKTDRYIRSKPKLKELAFALAKPEHGRMMVTAVNALAQQNGVHTAMTVADARAMLHGLQVLDDTDGLEAKVLGALGEWCIRYSPLVSVDLPDGLLLDATGCCHLWGGEAKYLQDITSKLAKLGYQANAAISETVGCSWGVARTGRGISVIEEGGQMDAIMPLPSWALRLEVKTAEKLVKLGLGQVKGFIGMPRQTLRKRFGDHFITRLDQALGYGEEFLAPVRPVEAYQERLPCLEPVLTLHGIEIALRNLLATMCGRLTKEGKGLRTAAFSGFRVDGKTARIEVGTNYPSSNAVHLFKLFEFRFQQFEPATGIDVFVLEAGKVEKTVCVQEELWQGQQGLDSPVLSELLDRISTKFGSGHVQRYLPDEHYWPERSYRPTTELLEPISTAWQKDSPRPLHLLEKPEAIEVTAPVPDYPPMNFRYKGQLHKVAKADGPERIEQEWWLQEGQHRDYYCVEDEEGKRYWLFRLGHYDAAKTFGWFLHGFFA